MSDQERIKALNAEVEQLRAAVGDFHGAYLMKFGRPSTGGVRANAPLRDDLGKLLGIAYAERGK